jgi:hypothetical protein
VPFRARDPEHILSHSGLNDIRHLAIYGWALLRTHSHHRLQSLLQNRLTCLRHLTLVTDVSRIIYDSRGILFEAGEIL